MTSGDNTRPEHKKHGTETKRTIRRFANSFPVTGPETPEKDHSSPRDCRRVPLVNLAEDLIKEADQQIG
jgi:hypothetical protein